MLVLKPGSNSAGAWKLGTAALREPETNGSRLRLLACLDRPGEGESSLPARDKLDFLVVLTPYPSAAAIDRADVVIPVASWLEKEGTYSGYSGGPEVKAKQVLIPPPGLPTMINVLADIEHRLSSERAGASGGN